jgi:hypothetical protein
MVTFLSFIFSVLLPIAIGILGIYLSIDFFEYLKKNHALKYRQLSFESVFGVSAENFPFHLVKPLDFIRFLFSPDNLQDSNVMLYKKKIKLFLLGLVGFFALYSFYMMVT